MGTEQDEKLKLSVDTAVDSFVSAIRQALETWAAVAAPVGPQGPIGPQGTQGLTGPQGDRGPPGPRGEPGHPGTQGPEGPIGPAGRNGAQGGMGDTGPPGPQGMAGPQGPEGPKGDLGPQGPQGPRGVVGADGPPGPMRPRPPTSVFTTNYTFRHTDQDGTIHAETGVQGGVIYTIPTKLPPEFYVRIIQTGNGPVKFIPGPGTTLVNRREHTSTAGRFSEVFIRSIGPDIYLLTGDTA